MTVALAVTAVLLGSMIFRYSWMHGTMALISLMTGEESFPEAGRYLLLFISSLALLAGGVVKLVAVI